jgi:2'-5' RNA ligase
VYSCNAPVPREIARLARGLAAECFEATPRDRHSLLLKRLGEGDPGALAGDVRSALSGTPPFEARVTGVECFRDPPVGRGPVAYLAVESPAIEAIHRKLCAAFDPIDELEGEAYVPHVTIARGGDAGRLAGREIDPITWTVESLSVWSAAYDALVERISLPA